MERQKYQTFDVMPAFEQATCREDGKHQSSAKGCPLWSGASQPPEIGRVVNIRMNSIGLAKVVGYFVEDGYLGLLVKLFAPPD